MKRIHIYVKGLVQGVFFRHNTIVHARELDLKGWVKNLIDGRVEILCEGNDESVDKLVAWCKIGPIGAQVEEVEIQQEEVNNEFQNFEIIY